MEPYVIGYSHSEAKIEGLSDIKRPSIALTHPGWDSDWPEGRPCYRINFFTSLPSKLQERVQDPPSRLQHLPPHVNGFLQFTPGDLDQVKQDASTHPRPPEVQLVKIQLKELISHGRTCDVWRAVSSTPELLDVDFPIIVKMISNKCLPSAVVETMFYKHVLSKVGRKIKEFKVPRWVGTYASEDGGWFAIVFEDVGESVGKTIEWDDRDESMEMDEWKALSDKAGALHRQLKKLGIWHGDISPRNVLRGADGQLYLIDFGDATLHWPKKT